MSGDYSRETFDPSRDFSGVLMQQGRVQLDADWNEWNEIFDRRWRAETIDIIGRGTVPNETPDGFKIEISDATLTIGRGRIYVDGLLAENRGKSPEEFDAVLSELRGTLPVPFNEQPYFPNAATVAPIRGVPHLVYLDVWQREVTYLQDPGLIEKAVGVDTTTRLQTVWQVRVLAGVGTDVTCATPDDQVAGWLDIIRPSDGRLSTDAVGVATSDDPCVIPPTGGYRGLENRLYRVEIHEGGEAGTATFKWSRDNASIATSVTAITTALDKLTVARVGRDNTLRFTAGDWIEVTDDYLEFAQQPGIMRQIEEVDDTAQTITLTEALPSGTFQTDSERHTRITRWDQKGKVTDTKGNVMVDLDASGSSGLIPVPTQGTSIILEDGVQVTFNTAASGIYRVGDFWCFAARTADASVEKLVEAPPRGIHHHYCRLAIVTFPSSVTDCRHLWPPSFGEAGCDCTVCITAEQHNQGTFTIHQAVTQLLETGGTICLGPGTFNLAEPVEVSNNTLAIRIRGQGSATVVIPPPNDAAFAFVSSKWCTLDYLTIKASGQAISAIRLSNAFGTTIERVIVDPSDTGTTPLAGILLETGVLADTRIRENFFQAQFGVQFTSTNKDHGALVLWAFYCEGNILACTGTGIQLDGATFLYDIVIARNHIFGTAVTGIYLTGEATCEVDVISNTIKPSSGDGVLIGSSFARVSDNEVVNTEEKAGVKNGIRLTPSPTQILDNIAIIGNRLEGLNGTGITIETQLSAALIEDNMLSAIQGDGITMLFGSSAECLTVLNNQLSDIHSTSTPGVTGVEIAGIYLRGVSEGSISGNQISAIGVNSPTATLIAGIRVDSCVDVRVSDNTITDIAPASSFSSPASGILVNAPLVNIEIADNLIRRQVEIKETDASNWEAIRILGTSNPPAPPPPQNKKSRSVSEVNFPNIDGLSTSAIVATVGSFAAAVSPGSEQVGIISNSLHGYGGRALVEVQVSGSCRFGDNYCACTLGDNALAAIELSAASLIVSTNRVECDEKINALDLAVSDASVGKHPAGIVLGNIVGGLIRLNGAPLDATWLPLNMQVT